MTALWWQWVGFIGTATLVQLVIFGYPLYRALTSGWLKMRQQRTKALAIAVSITLSFALLFFISRSLLLTWLPHQVDAVHGLMRYLNNTVGWFILWTTSLLFLDIALLALAALTGFGRKNESGFFRSVANCYAARSALTLRISFLLTLLLFSWGVWQFHQPVQVNEYTLTSDKISQPVRVVHISDTQYGSLNRSEIAQVAAVVNQQLAKYAIDAIFFTGDIIDTNKYSEADLAPLAFAGAAPSVQKIMTTGNHEYYHDYHKIIGIMQGFGYRLLDNAAFDLNRDIRIIGINDQQISNIRRFTKHSYVQDKLSAIRLSLPQPQWESKWNVLLYHRPNEAMTMAQQGINLMLTGHTHGGQMFPGTVLVRWLYDFPPGMAQVTEEMTLYTSMGAGLWGPRIRLGSRNEITIFHLLPAKSSSKSD